MTEDSKPLAENRLGKHGPVVDVPRSALSCYFRPDTEEFIFLSAKEAGAFENHWRGMAHGMNQFHQAQARYSSALKHYDQCVKAAVSMLQMDKSLNAIDAAEAELEKERKAIKEKLDGTATGVGYDTMVELIPMSAHRSARRLPYAYVKQSYFTDAQSKRRLQNISLRPSRGKSGKNSIISRSQNGQTQIDTGKLREQLTAFEWPKVKLELKDVLEWAGSDLDLEKLQQDTTLFDWADSWNRSLQGTGSLTDNIDVSAAAQFMRFTSNLGANAEFDVKEGHLAFKGEGRVNLTLASGYADIEGHMPDRFGWPLKMRTGKGNTVDLGFLRIRLSGLVNGYVGGSLQIEAQVQVMVKGDEQIITGQAGRMPGFRERKKLGRDFVQAMEAEDRGVTVSTAGFGGATLGFLGNSAVQWLKPSPPPEGSTEVAVQAQPNVGNYVDFATIGWSISGMVGIGAGGKFFCTFINGKFCLHIAASLCSGMGAKGGFIAEVSANDFIEFGKWVAYQLYLNNYGMLEYFNADAFKAYSQYCVLKVSEGGELVYQGVNWVLKSPFEIARHLQKVVDSLKADVKDAFEQSEKRNKIANVLIEQKDVLLTYTPETKGIFLYLLTRHGKADHVDLGNRSWNGDVYHRRKEAIILILRSIQTTSEWSKVMCRITSNGSRLPGEAERVSKAQEDNLIRFLQEGLNRDEELREIRDGLVKIYERLKEFPAVGYALEMNDSYHYRLNCDNNPHYPTQCIFDPVVNSSGENA